MIFSTRAEYGVRLMVELGRQHSDGPTPLNVIADAEGLPLPYLEHVVAKLKKAGLVVSTRGAHGGYELARRPAEINMSEVLRALEGPLAPMICATDEPGHDLACDRTSSCTVNLLWIRVRDAVAGALDGVTLADLVPPKPVALQPRTADQTSIGIEGALTAP